MYFILMMLVTLIMPLMMVGFGLLFMKNPPKSINSLYGYRTRRSTKNQETWDFAHYYFGKIWYKYGLISIPVSLFPFCLVIGKSDDVITMTTLIVMGLQSILLVVTIILTERALKTHFDETGKPL
ncbi:MAG: SdpI family protein [Bacteroidales bacterium]|nr:SdpI family protein [Bacteroidales bacterium]